MTKYTPRTPDEGAADLHGIALLVLVVCVAGIAALLLYRLLTHAPTGL